MPGIQDQYPSLPGQVVQLQDGNLNKLKRDATPAATESVLFIGTAIDGPVLEPVRPTIDDVESIFGKDVDENGIPNGATLVRAFKEAYNAGCRDIRLMRVSGTQATATVTAPAVTETISNIVYDETLGTADGNVAADSVFTLSKLDNTLPNAGNTLVNGSIKVTAGNLVLAADKYTVAGDNSTAPVTVTLKDSVCDSEANVIIEYVYANGGDNVSVTEGPFIAHGANQTFTLDFAAAAKGDIQLYAANIQLVTGAFDYTAGTKTITLKPGYADRGVAITANYSYSTTKSVTPTITLVSKSGGQLYNSLKVEVATVNDTLGNPIAKEIKITKPDAKKTQLAEEPLTYSAATYPTFEMLVNAINADPNNNVVSASTENGTTLSANITLKALTSFTGGADQIALTKEELYKALGGERDEDGYLTKLGAYQLLENYAVDWVVPLGVFADDKLIGRYDNFAYQLGLACAIMTHRNKMTTGVIATSSPVGTGLKAIDDHVKKLEANPLNYFMLDRAGNELRDSEGNRIDLGQFLQVLAGPDIIVKDPRYGYYAVNSVASYVGFVSTLASESSPMNKNIDFTVGLRFEYSNGQLERLTKARYVTFKTKDNGGKVAVTDAPMAAQPSSDYSSIVNVRTVKVVVDNIRIVADPYIGEPNSVGQRNALSSAIAKRMDKLKDIGKLQAYDFQVVSSLQDQLVGDSKIEVGVIAPQSMRKITTVVGLRPTL